MNIDSRLCAVVNTYKSYHDVLFITLRCYFRYVKNIKLFYFLVSITRVLKMKILNFLSIRLITLEISI